MLGMVVSTVAPQQGGSEFESTINGSFLCAVCIFSLQLCGDLGF